MGGDFLFEARSDIRRYHGKAIAVDCGGDVAKQAPLQRSVWQGVLLLMHVGVNCAIDYGDGPRLNEALR